VYLLLYDKIGDGIQMLHLPVHSPSSQMCSCCNYQWFKESEVLVHCFVPSSYPARHTDFFVSVWKLSGLHRVFLLIGMKR
jgi:hypothetical protein